ncbi:Zn-dependent alcohol dehydrogenase [Methylobacterium sp. AMS5]|nr:Zn-dependent alcohol dehydrogenase [Methylobacterium sp. AMS5]
MFTCTGYAATSAETKLAPFAFERRDPGANDIEIEIVYCGVCHSDLHQVRNEWQNTFYPCVPGHEIVGRVTRIGAEVGDFNPGELAAVGCMVDSCRTCTACREGLEQYCEPGFTATYNGPEQSTGANTFGGYSSHIVVDRHFVRHVPEGLDLAGVAPLLCAGVTTWSPLRRWGPGPARRSASLGWAASAIWA